MGRQREVFSATLSREGAHSKSSHLRNLASARGVLRTASELVWSTTQLISRAPVTSASQGTLVHAPPNFVLGRGRITQLSEISPAFPPPLKLHRSRPQGKHLQSDAGAGGQPCGFCLKPIPGRGTSRRLTLAGNGEGAAGCHYFRCDPTCVLRGLPQVGLECIAGPPAPPLN